MAKIDGTHIGGQEYGPVRWRLPPGKTLNPTMNHIGRLILGDLKRRMQLSEITQGQSIIHTFADGVTVQAFSIFGEDGMADYDEIRITGGKERDICIGFIARIVCNDFHAPNFAGQVFGKHFRMRVKEPWVYDADRWPDSPDKWHELYAQSNVAAYTTGGFSLPGGRIQDVMPAADGSYYRYILGEDVHLGTNPDKDKYQAFMGTVLRTNPETAYYAIGDFWQREDPVVRVIGQNYTIDGDTIVIEGITHNQSTTIDMDLNVNNPGYDPTIPATKTAVTSFAIPWRQKYRTSQFYYTAFGDGSLPVYSYELAWDMSNAVPGGEYEIEIVTEQYDMNYSIDIVTLGSKYPKFEETNDTIDYENPPQYSEWVKRGKNKYVVTVGREVEYIKGAPNPHVKAVEN